MGLIALRCPQCGADIELDDTREFGFCQYCGTKIMQERQNIHLSGSVSVDRSGETANLLIRAQTLMQQGRRTDAVKIYERILEIDPANGEAANRLREVESVITSPNVLINHICGNIKSSAKINYAIDGRKVGKFDSGSSFWITMPVGTHRLTFWYTGASKNDVDIVIRDCYTKIDITLQAQYFGKMIVTVKQALL